MRHVCRASALLISANPCVQAACGNIHHGINAIAAACRLRAHTATNCCVSVRLAHRACHGSAPRSTDEFALHRRASLPCGWLLDHAPAPACHQERVPQAGSTAAVPKVRRHSKRVPVSATVRNPVLKSKKCGMISAPPSCGTLSAILGTMHSMLTRLKRWLPVPVYSQPECRAHKASGSGCRSLG
jgi:hypothetical protein